MLATAFFIIGTLICVYAILAIAAVLLRLLPFILGAAVIIGLAVAAGAYLNAFVWCIPVALVLLAIVGILAWPVMRFIQRRDAEHKKLEVEAQRRREVEERAAWEKRRWNSALGRYGYRLSNDGIFAVPMTQEEREEFYFTKPFQWAVLTENELRQCGLKWKYVLGNSWIEPHYTLVPMTDHEKTAYQVGTTVAAV